MAVYLDSSAIVKLVVAEAESAALRRDLRRHPIRVSSALARVEVVRGVRGRGAAAVARAEQVLARLALLRLDDDILGAAASMGPAVLRSHDAIHLASAGALGAELSAVVTSDRRMRDAAKALGMKVVAPG